MLVRQHPLAILQAESQDFTEITSDFKKMVGNGE